MVATKESICNMALGYVGGNLVSDLTTDDTTEADLCNANWDNAKDFVLEARDWTFARKRAEITKDATAPDFEWGSRFAVPTDLLVVRRIAATPTAMARRMDFEKEDGWFLTNTDSLYVIYTYQVTDVTKFSPAFIRALVFFLASVLCPAIAANAKLEAGLYEKFEYVLNQAGGRDGVQSAKRMVQVPLGRRSSANRYDESYLV